MAKPMPSKTAGNGTGDESGATMRQVSDNKAHPVASGNIFSSQSRKSAFEQIPEIEKKKLHQEFGKLMRESYKEFPGEGLKMQEQGGWIVKNPDGTYSLMRVENTVPWTNHTKDLWIDLGDPPANAIGSFHTHPDHAFDILYPSDTDIDTAKKHSLPGIIMGPNPNTRQFESRDYDWTTKKLPLFPNRRLK
jgi:proteasome lid subunit RPN8/RPN11